MPRLTALSIRCCARQLFNRAGTGLIASIVAAVIAAIISSIIAPVVITAVIAHIFAFVIRSVFHAVVVIRRDFFVGVFLRGDFFLFRLRHVEGLILGVRFLAADFLLGD